MTSEHARSRLLGIARAAVLARVRDNSGSGSGGDPNLTPAELASDDVADRRQGVFVTVRVGDELRGCIGHIEADSPLPDLIARCATAACSTDPRFSPLTEADLPSLRIEISLLGELEPVTDPDEIGIGRHGLLVEKGWRRGLLLPQVATAWRWDQNEFIAQTCRKAGLSPDAWRHGAKLWRFEAEVLSEP